MKEQLEKAKSILITNKELALIKKENNEAIEYYYKIDEDKIIHELKVSITNNNLPEIDFLDKFNINNIDNKILDKLNNNFIIINSNA